MTRLVAPLMALGVLASALLAACTDQESGSKANGTHGPPATAPGAWITIAGAPSGSASYAVAGSGESVLIATVPTGGEGPPELWWWRGGSNWVGLPELELPAGRAAFIRPLPVHDGTGTTFVVGTLGVCEAGEPTKSEAALLEGDAWEALAPAPFSLGCASGASIHGDELIVVANGLHKAAIYSQAMREWTAIAWPNSQGAVWDGSQPLSPGSSLVVAEAESAGRREAGPTFAAWDWSIREWRVLPPIQGLTNHPQLSATEYIKFGASKSGFVVWDGVNLLVLDGSSWKAAPPSPLAPRDGAAVAVQEDGTVLVWGGATPRGEFQQRADSSGAVFFPTTNRWIQTPRSPLPAASTPLATTLMDGSFYVDAGTSPGGPDGSRALLTLTGSD